MAESKIQREIQLAAPKLGARLFRNNVALGWVGKSTRFKKVEQITVRPGDVVVRCARPLHAGLCVGSSDLIGWVPITITAEMVGRTVAVFSGVEVKTTDTHATEDQSAFIDVICKAGGIGLVARSVSDLERGILGYNAGGSTRPGE
jgi:hypothetical protein